MGRISDFQIIKRGTMPALCVKSQPPLKNLIAEIQEARDKLEAYLQLIDEYPAGPFYVHYHSFSKKRVDMEVGFPVYQEIAGEEEVEPAEVRAGTFLSALYLGPHKDIPELYQEMDQWLVQHHYETTGASEEVYLNEISDWIRKEQLVTLVMIPIQPLEN